PAEIARAFLTTEAAVLKRLVRAKEQIRDARLPFEIPEGPDLAARLDGVLRSLYLLFSEGHAPSRGENPVRAEICEEALRLAALLAAHPAGNRPPTHALLALLLFGAARLPARVDDGGNLLLIQEQDRARWDGGRIAAGLRHLALSAAGGEITAYHCQAGIAATHMTAPDYAATDWAHIVALYDQLARIAPSPVVALNRAVAVANLRGPVAGLGAVAAIPPAARAKLARYPHFHAVLGELASRCHDPGGAALHFTRALGLAGTRADRTLLEKKLAALSFTPTLH
ncbi:MAG TPA: DUF6596 domain-containing protein, partial [Candidatus Methylacidiphilales bacterium]